jgi:hypothetical protein
VIVSDPNRVMGDFLRDFHRDVANAMKVLRTWDGIFWDGSPTSVVRIHNTAAFIGKSGYVIANPVEALAVESSKSWPGLIVHAHEVGLKEFTAKRPTQYFDPESWPESITLKLTMPELVGVSDEEIRDAIAQEAERLESEARYKAHAEGKHFQGARKAKSISPRKRSTTREVRGKRNPTFAVGHNNLEAYKAAAHAVCEFRRRYRQALDAWREGFRDVLFPAGTYQMDWLHHANIAPF